jgi:hypothetical protein
MRKQRMRWRYRRTLGNDTRVTMEEMMTKKCLPTEARIPTSPKHYIKWKPGLEDMAQVIECLPSMSKVGFDLQRDQCVWGRVLYPVHHSTV